MKICSAEAMKIIKELEEEKNQTIANEDRRSTVSYKEGETKTIPDYDYKKTRSDICELDDKIRALKFKVAKSNCETLLTGGFDCSVREGLVLLAQLRSRLEQAESLADTQQLTRRITSNGVLEFTECLYSVKEVENELKDLNKQIGKLQIAIDSANLTNEIEI